MANRTSMVSLAAMCISMTPTQAWCQQVAAAADSSVDETEILVTAQRRTQAIQDVTATISVINGDAISKRGALEIKDIGQLTPNVTIEGSYGNASNPVITIRGVGIEDFNDNNSSPAGVYVDEVYYVAPPMLAFGLYDLERVEILKGPQGTLYGRNTTSGAVNFLSRKPTSDWDGFARANYESFDRTTLEAAIGGPISQTLSFRASGLLDKGGDYIRNRFNDSRNGGRDFVGGRFQLAWKPSDSFDLLLNIHAARDRSDLGQYQHVGFLADPATFALCDAAIAGRLDPANCFDPLGYSDTDGDRYAGAYNRRSRLEYSSIGTSARAQWKISDAVTLTSITAFEGFDGVRYEDSDASPNQLLEIDYGVDVEQFSQEVRLAGKSGRLDWVIGGYFGKDTIRSTNDYDVLRDFRPITGFDPDIGVFLARNRYVQRTDVYAGFGHGFWNFTGGWTLEAGLRFARETRDFRTISSFVEDTVDLANAGLGADGLFLDETRALRKTNLLWTAGLSNRISRDLLLYAKVSNGFKSGGFNGGIPFTPDEVVPFDEENLLAYEIGFKGSVRSIRLRYEASVFYYDYEDLQVFTLADTTAAVPIQILTNAADSRIYGLDSAAYLQLAKGLEVSVGLGLLKTEYLRANIGGRDFSGQPLPNAPELSLTLGADYERQLGRAIGRINLNGRFQSSERIENTQIGPDGPTIIDQSGHWLIDARASVAFLDDRLEFAIFAKNLFDVEPLTSTLSLPSFGFSEYTYGARRRVGASLTVRM